ncbi:ABC transporter substrate-binding protein [Gordonia sp. (in: high G+C Gram-positive bacteria)]|uniref:ABC transporter substrate-binding protein n=1 Tax=Gordonia sp. (in: high G+C Gram-positive bacteria) TaxID=84139 RepID=UPI0016922918|nr:ABC transporter substrate-binding protein [Gordonia sp. (in: high G+C Gram-positive bacteria)]NLG46490.1 ABC transporter substrate-binding protein [Gordonia sp. (in: high G+C Gram-positive bacteria)]
MFSRLRRGSAVAAAVVAAGFALTACSTASEETSASGESITVTTNSGDVEVTTAPKRVVVLDNTAAETVKAFGITPVAVPKQLFATDQLKEWTDNDAVKDVGTHNEPKFDVIEDVEPDLIIGGYRFSKYNDDLKKVGDAVGAPYIDIAASDDAADGRVAAMIRQTETLGEIFGKQEQAKQIVDDFQTKLNAAKGVAEGKSVFLAVVSGGKIDNGAKRLSPLVAPLNVKDVFGGEGGDLHQNSGLTPEAIAQANPEWVLAMDRDAAVKPENGQQATPAAQVFAAQEAFKGTTFADKNQIVHLDPQFYLREGIQCYGDNYQTIADAMGAK